MTLRRTPIETLFGARLRQLREAQGLSQAALAERVEVSPEYVSRIERGRGGPSLRMVGRLADGLGVAPSELFLGPHQAPEDMEGDRLAWLVHRSDREERALLLRLAETVLARPRSE